MKVTTSTNGIMVEGVEGYEGYAFVVGFPLGGSKPNGFYVSTPDDAPVTPTLIRRLPLDKLLKVAAEARVDELGQALAPTAAGRPYGGGQDHTRKVAEVYDWAVGHGVPPRRAIAARWARSEATAGRWIAEARRMGLIPPHGQ
ncbi:hypothetical protein J7F03_38605 [Streptomyces sp. ISL-43]|uniref:hypothetical protein n=1 Tax=Streptomyces sp. ISL-43 TaxID=2819183 RepID=UPI001BE8076C|nr:hypothetical protein [Streptomyces sp. ISL-43]MBT2452845.1 hypothetical protein [Streptomyces sp. ISL-43]